MLNLLFNLQPLRGYASEISAALFASQDRMLLEEEKRVQEQRKEMIFENYGHISLHVSLRAFPL
jgi:hypothetical protein